MAHPANRGRRKPKEEELQKATDSGKYNVPVDTNLNPQTNRMRLGAYSLPSLQTVQGQIYEEARKELRFPQASKIYKQMSYDANVASAVSLIEAMISRAEWRIECPKDAPEEEKKRAEMLNYNLLITERPFHEYIGEMLSYLIYGFHTPEKIYAKLETPVGNFIGLQDLITISQDTVHEWIFDRNTGKLAGLEQDLSQLPTSSLMPFSGKSKVEIPRKKFMLFRNNPKRNNPEGKSPLDSCYLEWKYLSLVSEFETIYATKGLGGILDLGIDVSFLAKAAADTTSDEALVVEQMKLQAANFHNGDEAFVITPLAYNEKGNPLFHTKILETTPPDTNDIIKRHEHRILMCFFADILQLGSNGGGSFALAENKSPLLMTGITYHLNNITRTLNHDLIPQLYEMNGWEFDARTACRFINDEIDEISIDEFSKAIQRILSTSAIQHTSDVEDVIRDRVFDLPPLKESGAEIRQTEMQSKAGDGMESGMPNGTGDASEGGDDSVSNGENA